ncbi:hypothetical protein KKG24_04960 [Patescibacteria group bacterium]|nr:hypothetical protein [Patescibacteria group bacterium]
METKNIIVTGVIVWLLGLLFYILEVEILLAWMPIFGTLIILFGIYKLFEIKNKKREYNKKLSLIGLGIFIISIITEITGSYYTAPIMIIGLLLIVFGGIKNTKYPAWIKWISTLILTFLTSVGMFLLFWGFNTGFQFTF